MTINVELPPPLAPYFAAANAGDIDAQVSHFTADARVKDEGEWRQGHAAIADWARDTRARYQHHATPLSTDSDASAVFVNARVEGSFPGSPVVLRYRFELVDGLIDRLEIVAA
ncbi:nuclear transport factor 2 family protein [Saccharospirillum mangrovi]|uniref:nuclear transport factor 2 family protein n=1 Tax=Saccharospirillum mangrovi TaxID=2161747 RepID=UPI00130027D7|nr:nuclear transport factor 2 family protein [Saccharospirillum mangrovi]